MQASLKRNIDSSREEYGGESRQGLRKVMRPFRKGRPLLLEMRASRARGAWSFQREKNRAGIEKLKRELSRRYGVKVLRVENLGNRVRMLATFPGRGALRAFLRVFTQRLMFLVTGARKGNPQGKFFDAIAYSRVVDWAPNFARAVTTFRKNLDQFFTGEPSQRKEKPS